MSDPIAVALITAVGLVISGTLSTVVIVLLKHLDVKVDGRLTELLDVSRQASAAKGHAEGIKAEQERVANGGKT